MLIQMRGNLGTLPWCAGGQTYKHMGFVGIADAVVEFGDGARRLAASERRQVAQHAAKALETAALFGNGHSKQGFTFFTDLGAFCHKPQTVKVDVGATQYRSISFALCFVLGHIFFDGSYCHGA